MQLISTVSKLVQEADRTIIEWLNLAVKEKPALAFVTPSVDLGQIVHPVELVVGVDYILVTSPVPGEDHIHVLPEVPFFFLARAISESPEPPCFEIGCMGTHSVVNYWSHTCFFNFFIFPRRFSVVLVCGHFRRLAILEVNFCVFDITHMIAQLPPDPVIGVKVQVRYLEQAILGIQKHL